MGEVTRAGVAGQLIAAGTKPDMAALYADAFLEWREAIANIEKNGSVVANPRTGAPEENPYLRVRDKAFDRLRKMRGVSSGSLWLHECEKSESKKPDSEKPVGRRSKRSR